MSRGGHVSTGGGRGLAVERPGPTTSKKDREISGENAFSSRK